MILIPLTATNSVRFLAIIRTSFSRLGFNRSYKLIADLPWPGAERHCNILSHTSVQFIESIDANRTESLRDATSGLTLCRGNLSTVVFRSPNVSSETTFDRTPSDRLRNPSKKRWISTELSSQFFPHEQRQNESNHFVTFEKRAPETAVRSKRT